MGIKPFPVWGAIILFLLSAGGGCIDFQYDDEAADAAVKSCFQLKNYDNSVITLDAALNMAEPEKRNQLRLNFAILCSSEKLQKVLTASPEKLQSEIVRHEKARIRLNTLLGYHPEVPVRYNSEGALSVPEKLPPVSTVWKAALIVDGGKNPDLPEKIYIAHLETLAEYDRCENISFPDEESRIRAMEKRVIAVIHLAESAGISFYMIPYLDSFERRFDRAVEEIHR